MSETLNQLNQDIEKSPNNPEFYLKRAQFYFDHEDYGASVDDCQTAIKLNPVYADAFALLSYAFYRLKKPDDALVYCEKALSLDSQSYVAYTVRGNLKCDLKDYGTAFADYDMAIKINEHYASAYYARGISYHELKQYEEALKDYTKAIEIDEKYARAYNNRGIAYYNLKQYENALKDYTKAIEINVKYAGAYYNRGNAYCELKQHDNALKDYTKTIEIDEKYAPAYNNRGNAYKALKQYNNALKDYTKTIEIDEKYALAYNNRALLYYYTPLKDINKALADFTVANELFAKENNNLKISLTNGFITEIKGLLRKAPTRNSRIQSLMTKIEESDIIDTNQQNEESFRAFIEEKKVLSGSFIAEFVVLRRWNSYTPIIADNFHTSKGGGYFFHAPNCGIVIDPGFNFIDNFKAAGYKFSDIDHILITHAHNDHTTDLESILTLLHEYNEAVVGSFDNPADGTIIKDVREEINATDEDRERVEQIAKERLIQSPRRKRIRLYMTISTYKKYCNLLEIFRKSDYDVEIIKAGETITLKVPNDAQSIEDYVKGIQIRAIYAKHNDMMSDKDSVGFVIEYGDFVLIYTGDTGYDPSIGNQYAKIAKDYKNNKIILLAHLGGFKRYENRYNVGDFDGGKAFYKNHLGRLGLARLIELVKPYTCIISEFGEEFRGARCKLKNIFKEVYPDTIFFPADIGFRMNTERLIRAVVSINTRDNKLTYDYISPEEAEACEIKVDASLHYHKRGIDIDDLREIVAAKYR